MKVAISDITDRIKSKPTIDEISKNFFNWAMNMKLKIIFLI